MDIVFQCDEFASLPRVLCHQSEDFKKAALTVDEILVANIGDAHVEPHLLVS